ncbi:cell division protein FtsL-like protein [Buchnera aphidicola str. Bp (Baizongia pistaciae)]|uniref:Cell division protein FtsL n=1 Tax=Buchnera aphidicola subsp. Baizongia pistaciae (strain Bp) TaxID=224915 RepID=FTSL_BUCBP|nr:cell division protein FtsL [Buchnera aphidicola]Q89AP9.1 RecName: Full=Cell division protein FtsL [Buchnera aphidicola str. Bp (Baizongia pistaciae)]AAO26937.1 cell division protein FtsL-like protein [Buchnera aphidicola str. Bp (Baizongia pistaciae)]
MNKNYNLSKIIFNDLISFYKTQLILIFMIFISALLIITIIHKTRLLTSQQEELDIIKKKQMPLNLEKYISTSRLKFKHEKIDT